MFPRVAIVEYEDDPAESLERALKLIGKIDDLNTFERSTVIKVGVFDHRADNHTTVDVAQAIVKSFSRSSKIFLAESDNYRGTGLDRLQLWKQVFSDRILPFNLSDDKETRKVKLAGEEMRLSHIVFKPNVLVSTHVLRIFEQGSILKNLFGLILEREKARWHKKLDVLLPDIYEAVGGVDLAVLDGTYFYSGFGARLKPKEGLKAIAEKMNTLVVGRDAVAVETVGAVLAGLEPEKMPILQGFVKRGLGEGDLKKIEVVGSSFEDAKEKFKQARERFVALAKERKKTQGGGATTWGGNAHRIMKIIVQEGFFKDEKRTRKDVAKAFEVKGLPTKGYERNIANILTLRVKRKILKATKEEGQWLYWTE